MADFVSGRTDYDNHGKRQILRSAQAGSYTKVPKTIGHLTYPTETISGFANQKVLQPGEALAVCTSGVDAGKVVPFQLGGPTDGRELIANLVGISGDYFGYELTERDVEAGVYVQAYVYQSFCTQRDATGARVVLTNAVADALRGKKNLDILFAG